MTNEQINAAIAEACGWTGIHDSGPWHNHKLWGYPPMKHGQGGNAYKYLPDYCADLNAMHDAEKVLRDKELLFEYGMHISNSHHYEYLLRATARERAEAFLRTLGKWEATNEHSSADGSIKTL
jgi:hypothetical protein